MFPRSSRSRTNVQDLPVVEITRRHLLLNGKTVNINLLAQEIHKRFHNATAVYLRADHSTPWEPIADVIAALGDAKLAVNIVTQPEDEADKRR